VAETDSLAPWGPRSGEPAPPEAPAAPPAAKPPSRAQTLLWGAISTALLAVFIAWQLGWLAALAIVFGVFVHEFGHVLVINWAGSGPSSIRIIPFLGGAATMKRAPDSDFKGVLIALAGPAMGLVAALPFFAAAALTGERAWLAGAFFIGLLNFVNLAPAPPLDGSKALGPVLARIHPILERAALLVVGLLAVAWGVSHGSYIFAAFIAVSVMAAAFGRAIRAPARPLTWREWAISLALYAVVLSAAAAVIGASLGGALPAGLANFFRFGG
jgi:Zn-dependent protease